MTALTNTPSTEQQQQQQPPSTVVVKTPPSAEKRPRSKSLRKSITKLVILPFGGNKHRRGSQETLDANSDSDADSFGSLNSENSSSNSDQQQEPLEGSILKIRSHATSLAQTYTTPPGLPNHTVSFGSIEVLIFPITMGDNPSVSAGVPIAMGHPLHARMAAVDLMQYEETRPVRRHKRELAVPKAIREEWLRDEGFSRGQWREAEEEVLMIKKSRKQSTRCSAVTAAPKAFLHLFASSSKKKNGARRTSVLRS